MVILSGRKKHIINHQIKASKLRVITSDGENLGVISKEKALKEAQNRKMDLLLVSPNANPPVAKIVDFSKYLYEERKKTSGTKQKGGELKEFRMGPTTGTGDINRYINRSKEFIKEGNRVKVTVRMRGRENAHPEVAFDKLKEITECLEEVAKVESGPKRQGGNIWAIYSTK